VRERTLDHLEEAVGQDQHHVVDTAILDDLGTQRPRLAAVVVAQHLAQHLEGHVPLEIQDHVLAQVLDQSLHRVPPVPGQFAGKHANVSARVFCAIPGCAVVSQELKRFKSRRQFHRTSTARPCLESSSQASVLSPVPIARASSFATSSERSSGATRSMCSPPGAATRPTSSAGPARGCSGCPSPTMPPSRGGSTRSGVPSGASSRAPTTTRSTCETASPARSPWSTPDACA